MSRADRRRRCRNRRDVAPVAAAGFACTHCGHAVSNDAHGTHNRNHCPQCLWSRHLDITPGDRMSGCRQAMEPIAVSVRRDGEWMLVHRCTACGSLKVNRIAGDDSEFALLSLAARPIATLPFPVPGYRAPAVPEGREHPRL